MELGEKLKERRLSLGFTQTEVAEKLFVSHQTVSKWELGKSYPSLDTIVKISEWYEVSIDYLLKEDDKIVKYIDKKVKQQQLLTIALILLVVLYLFLIPVLVEKSISPKSLTVVSTNNISNVEFSNMYENELTPKTEITGQVNLRTFSTITGIDTEFSEGNLYISVLSNFSLFEHNNNFGGIELSEILKKNDLNINQIEKIYLVSDSSISNPKDMNFKEYKNQKEIFPDNKKSNQ